MCSRVENDEDFGRISRRDQPKDKNICVKCKKNATDIVVVHSSFCKDCFMTGVDNKFRTTMAKLQVLQTIKGEMARRVMIAWSGGVASTALLDLVATYASEKNRRQSISRPIFVVHVDEQEAPTDENDIRTWINVNYPDFQYVHLPCSKTASPESHWKSQTSRENFNSIAKLDTLLDCASQHQVDALFLGDTSTRLAINTLALVANGRGASLPMDLGFEVSIERASLTICRPMKEFNVHEIEFYAKERSIDSFSKIRGNVNSEKTIGRLAEQFIVGLSEEYPSTVNNVVRTFGKLTANEAIIDRDQSCFLCHMPCERVIKGPYCHSCRTVLDDAPEEYQPCDGENSIANVGMDLKGN